MSAAPPGDDASMGLLIAETLRSSWRASPEPPRARITVGLTLARRLLETGGAGLAWRRLASDGVPACEGAPALRRGYLVQLLEADARAADVAAVVRHLDDFGVQTVLLKGWSVARRYPAPGLRPLGDIDLLIPRRDRDRAVMCLRDWHPAWSSVDLHLAPPDLVGRSFDELLQRSRVARLGDTDVRIMADEELLRLLCLHYLRHGAWRPVWLCDIALLAETHGVAFDWDRCLRGARRDRERIACALRLAADLLGAAIPHSPLKARIGRVPGWMKQTVVTQWGRRYGRYVGPPIREIIRIRGPLLPALRARWPNALEASVRLDAPLRFWPRWPIQLADAALRLAAFSRSVALSNARLRAPAAPASSPPDAQ